MTCLDPKRVAGRSKDVSLQPEDEGRSSVTSRLSEGSSLSQSLSTDNNSITVKDDEKSPEMLQRADHNSITVKDDDTSLEMLQKAESHDRDNSVNKPALMEGESTSLCVVMMHDGTLLSCLVL